MDVSGELTGLLRTWRAGDPSALDQLIPLVDRELRAIARRYLRRERAAPTLDRTTALINETFACLLRQRPIDWESRAHFYAIAARLMRQILVDHARTHRAAKRGGGDSSVVLDEELVGRQQRSELGAEDVVAIHEALDRLAELDARQAKVVELRFFGGLTIGETAEVLAVSADTVKRDWRYARLWLRREVLGCERDSY
jgi:RNA polymerase sigma-70 factor (ECF subfamily)